MVADAAVTVLAREGLRGLTHRAVDREAALPQGSTSNCFRTRQDLLAAVVAHLEALDLAGLMQAGPPDVTSVAGLARDLAKRTGILSQPPHNRTLRARLALISSGIDLRQPHARFIGLLTDALGELGLTEPERSARLVTDLLEGALVHSVTSRPIEVNDLAKGVTRLVGD